MPAKLLWLLIRWPATSGGKRTPALTNQYLNALGAVFVRVIGGFLALSFLRW
jgi:hypothetical protein